GDGAQQARPSVGEDRDGEPAPARLGAGVGLGAAHAYEPDGKDNRLAGERRLAGLGRRLVIENGDLARQIVEHGAVMRLGEKPDDVGRHVRADAVDVEQVRAGWALGLLRRFHFAAPMRERAVVTGEKTGGRLADLRDAERVDKAVERYAAALVDRGDQLGGADFAPAFA